MSGSLQAARRSLAAATFDNNDDKTTLEEAITALEDEIKQLRLRQNAGQANQDVDLKDDTAIRAHLTNAAFPTYLEKRTELSKLARIDYLSGRLSSFDFRLPTVAEELNYWKQAGTPDEAKVDLKALDVIPVFKGESEAAWRAFEFPWLVAIRNRNISEINLKTAFYQRLQGAAAVYYLSLPRVETMAFGEILQALRDKYTSSSFVAQNKIKGMTQGPKESVADFAARMRVAAKGIFPAPPRELKVLKVSTNPSVEYVIPNPLLAEEERDYTEQYRRAESGIASNYLQGLRPEVQMRLNSRKYENLHDIIQEAEAAEWMKDSMSSGILHHIDEVNLLTPNFVKKAYKTGENAGATGYSRFSRSAPDKKEEPRRCFACGSDGHFIAECPQKNRRNNPIKSLERYASYQRRKPNNQRFRKQFPDRINKLIRPLSRRGIPSDKQNPKTRQWMVKNRARWNVRRRQFQKVFHIDIEDGLEMSDLEDEDQFLFMLEDQLDDPEEFEVYYQEVENETDQLEGEVEEQYDEDLWKTEEYWNQRKAEYEEDSKN
jgi:hypothetical protein